MSKVFIINGMARCGKDTFCKFIAENYEQTIHFSIIDSLKHYARQLNWNEDKDEKGRKFLYGLKQLTDEYDDRNFIIVKEKVNRLSTDKTVFLIDMREVKDIERARKELNAKIVLIKNNNISNITSNDADAGVFDISYDIEIDNSGSLDDLRNKAIDFIDKYIKE